MGGTARRQLGEGMHAAHFGLCGCVVVPWHSAACIVVVWREVFGAEE